MSDEQLRGGDTLCSRTSRAVVSSHMDRAKQT